MQAVDFAVQVPLLAGAQVVHQAVIVLLGDNSHIPDSRVDHAGGQEVDHAVSSGYRQRGNRPG